MSDANTPDDRVSRGRYLRERAARTEAEQLLEQKSRELYLANQELSSYSATLEEAVRERTADLELALKQAEIAGTAKSRFIATMSHEIRTPLGGMLGMIDLLAMDETDPAKLELLNYAVTAGNGLSRIVHEVLDFSKMEAGVFVFEEERVDVRALIESITMLAAANEKDAHRSILSNVHPDVPQIFLGDGTRIRQVISNFVSNAFRYSIEGAISINATASPHKKGALLRVEVQDFGIGIEEANFGTLFKDFSQVANPLTAAAQGAGLGLAICKRILQGCGGTIGVESEPGVGSTFWFELPVTVLVQSGPADTVAVKDSTDAPISILAGKRVLIAEDNIINQKLLMTYVRRMDLIPDLAENGRIALEMFDPATYDLVLMDVAMPEMDGLEATRRIRLKWGDTPLPPILALTAHVMDAIEDEAALVGIDTILSKPIPFEVLKHALTLALSDSPKTAPVLETVEETAQQTGGNAALFAQMAPANVTEMLELFPEEMLVDLVQKYVTDTTQRLDVIKQAVARNDAKAASGEGHSIKGASMALGFVEISQLAREIETETSSGQPALDVVHKIEVALEGISACL